MDINKYPEMVSGVDSCVTYADTNQNGVQIVKSIYEISALHMKFKYYVQHTYDPAQRCMVFHLDYDRRSDLDDTVGYWYVDPHARAKCRVYYSCECKLRGWVPGPVYKLLTEQAVKKATTWVERESMKEYRAQKAFKLPFNKEALQQLGDTLRAKVDAVKVSAARHHGAAERPHHLVPPPSPPQLPVRARARLLLLPRARPPARSQLSPRACLAPCAQLPSPPPLNLPPMKLPSMPLPKLPLEPQRNAAEHWFNERRRAATRLVSTVRPPSKATQS